MTALGGPANQSTSVVVSVSDDHLDRIDEVADRLTASGLRVEKVLTTLGTITGRIAPARIAEIEQLEGVSSVEAERVIQLPPPGSPIQ